MALAKIFEFYYGTLRDNLRRVSDVRSSTRKITKQLKPSFHDDHEESGDRRAPQTFLRVHGL